MGLDPDLPFRVAIQPHRWSSALELLVASQAHHQIFHPWLETGLHQVEAVWLMDLNTSLSSAGDLQHISGLLFFKLVEGFLHPRHKPAMLFAVHFDCQH